MDSTIMWILGTLALATFIFAYKSSQVRGKRIANMSKNFVVIFAVALGLGLLWVGGFGSYINSNLNTPFAAGIATGGQAQVAHFQPGTANCDLGTSVTVTLSAANKYDASAAGGTHRYSLNGAPFKTVADGGTFTAGVDDSLTVLWENGSTTADFSKVGTYTIPCKAAYTPTENNHPVYLVNNGSISASLKDSDDNSLDGTTNNQTLAAGDVKTVTTKLSGTYQADFPYGFVAVVEYNKTELDSVTLTGTDGSELSSASIPHSFSPTLGAESSSKAYNMPALISNADLYIKDILDASDSVNPSNGTVYVTLYPKNYAMQKNGLPTTEPVAEDYNNAVTRAGQFSANVNYD